ncbi:hypothetical protein Tco_1116466 [Tanacetum coccineum]
MSFDDLYNNFRIVKQEVKGTASSSSSSSSQNLNFVSSTSSTNEVNTAYGVSTANTQVSMIVSRDTLQGNVEDLEIKLKELNQDNEEVPTDMALMALSDSEVYTDKTCSKTCLKNYETLKKQYDDLRKELNQSEFNLATYKRGLASVEEQLVFYKKNEVIFYDQLVVLKRDISFKDSEISVLKSELEKLKQDKESNQLKIEKFNNASKCLDKIIGSQIVGKSKNGLGYESYQAVPPPPTGIFSPAKPDLSYSGIEEFQQHEFKGYEPRTSKNVSDNISDEI